MPTPQWFAENPKISAYISKDLDNALKAWMEENRIKKVSAALTTILEQFLGLTSAAAGVSPENYATLEQLQELQARVEALEKGSSSKKPESSPMPETRQQLAIDGMNSSGNEWLSAKQAHALYGREKSYDYFRKSSIDRFKNEFGLEADPSRKKQGGKPGLWLRKP